MLTWIMPASNLGSDGTASVGQFQGVGWTGTHDMAGNVREWCLNSFGDQRVILGGGWDDPPYMVQTTIFDPGSLPAFDRSQTNGFRLAVSADDRSVAQRFREPIPVPDQIVVGDPVSDDVFAAYLNLFDYDPVPLEPIKDEPQVSRYWTRQRISISAGSAGERIALYLYLPNTGSPPYQTVIYWPTHLPLLLDSVDQIRVQFDFLLKNGRAVMLPVMAGTFERRLPNYPDWGTIAGRDLVIQQMKDMRRSIDYLVSRSDIDDEALAFYGWSLGGRLGAIALAIEPRLKVGILNQAGLQHLKIRETSVLNYLSRINVPVLQFNGRYDTDYRFEDSAKPYFDLIGTSDTDKRHVVEETGHFVSRSRVIGETLDWLDKYLGPVGR
jgi:dienelactone hydrolase